MDKKIGVMILDCLACGSSVHSVFSDGKAECEACHFLRFVPEDHGTQTQG